VNAGDKRRTSRSRLELMAIKISLNDFGGEVLVLRAQFLGHMNLPAALC